MIHWVYLLRSIPFPDKVYVGCTKDLDQRLAQHQAGADGGYAAKYGPWKVVVAIQFDDRVKAEKFERYVKSGSGQSFARRHFW